MQRLIECVPNFSEGRDTAKVDALVAAMSGVPGAWVLDVHSDADHNRSVITLAGEPEAVSEAALRGIGKAAELIDLTRHTGAHPRIGATDVVPFVPVAGCTLEDCVALARRVGREIWERYRIPVYFYEAAATLPERTNLEDVRRGQFEGLREDALRDPDRSPDIGEPRLHATAGAVAVAARAYLIAYNINLNTHDASIAKNIARAVRYSSGGLRFVKAMGVELKSRGLAQVSMNLTDFEQTPLHRVFESVKREAERYGFAIAGSEIVGLIPRKALEMTAEYYLQLENFSSANVLEERLATAMGGAPMQAGGPENLAAMARQILRAVSALSPSPAGGTVAALAGALAASLGEVTAGLSRNNISQQGFEQQGVAAAETLRQAAHELTAAIDRETRSRKEILDAQSLSGKTTEERLHRESAMERANWRAAEVPLETAIATVEVFEKLVQLEAIAPPSMLSDLRVARFLAAAASRGALESVTVRLAPLRDSASLSEMKSRAAAIEARLAANAVTAGG